MFRVVRRQPICQAAFNGEFGNSRDASVHADGAKSRCPKRVAGALRRRNSLHMAIQIGVRACPRYRFHDCGPHSAQTEQGGETASLISLSQRPPILFRGATKCWPYLRVALSRSFALSQTKGRYPGLRASVPTGFSQTRSAMPSATRSFSVDHMMP